ncbi:hypothetical protein DTO013E5_1075 [Penicillium roqueforti]|uniref:Uncharacterized protein n=1 Tax=Penicillium roqueforti (strain FM164) TaxID=1365484 RepID=W6PW51_PENRF|nr:uncharacterized protein LCP9604111_1898 [Penicillium roqueforti]CDM28463.1 Protein of unknown function DUF3431 [Penicillium roqueforti FM164]KAF9251902.1 hypothetical protein LCP9604111_1898 [Penicillium roqueforti]KAI1836284.1 hypothetical protein CBS147337_2511 [Penicillium roqueforti]KAI2687608.1 hypothetical protein LCP963914a_3126 [Penicillium roqueforti]KAI2690042.1 hypothetical protein CBS147355_493 [Penicillium roqueforti]
MIFGCTVLLILKFCDLDAYRSVQTVDEALDTKQSEEAERTAALHELVKKTQSYNATTTKVALVMSKTRSDDLRWLRDYLQTHIDNTPFIYTMDKKPETELLVAHSSRGREASAYLSFIVDLYDELPEYSIFLHANPEQWHNDLFGPHTSSVLHSLRREAVDAMGYLNLRCTNNPGCPTHVNPNNPTQADIDKNDARANFPTIYKDIFGEDAQVPEHIGGICCAQFAVSRARIWQRPKSDYIRMLNWVNEKSVPLVDDYGVGWVFETLWHVVFGMEGIHCPLYEQCRCDNYGWCGPLPSGKTLTAIAAV